MLPHMFPDIGLVIAGYLLGSLSSAIILCRLAGLPDPREQGSGNPGATNVLRFGGRKLAILVLLGDLLKGLLPVWAGQALGMVPATVALTGVAAFCGHLYPLYFGFRGGKGVATALGVLLGFSWLLGVVTMAIWLAMAFAFRFSSLAAISAAVAAPFLGGWLTAAPAYPSAIAFMSLLLLLRHRSNIHNLLQGREPKIGQKSP